MDSYDDEAQPPYNYLINLMKANYLGKVNFTQEIVIAEIPNTLITGGISTRGRKMFNFCLLLNKGNSKRAKNVLFSTIKRTQKSSINQKSRKKVR